MDAVNFLLEAPGQCSVDLMAFLFHRVLGDHVSLILTDENSVSIFHFTME